MLYHKCNKDTDQLNINQALESTISSVPLLRARQSQRLRTERLCMQRKEILRMQRHEFRPKKDSWNIVKNEPRQKKVQFEYCQKMHHPKSDNNIQNRQPSVVLCRLCTRCYEL